MRLSSIGLDLFGEESRQQETLGIRNCLLAPSLATQENPDRLDDIRDRRRVNRSTGDIDSPLHASLAEDVIAGKQTADGFALDWRVDTIRVDVSRDA
jgi:hypothetical protein